MFKFKGEPQNDKVVTIIGKETYCQGVIETPGGLRIDGRLDGKLKADSVIIGESGEIKGDVYAKSVVVNGKIKGNIIATDYLEMTSKCRVHGDVQTKRLLIADGATLDGKCSMSESAGGENVQQDLLPGDLAPVPAIVAENPS